MLQRELLIVMTKVPLAGTVKTRLIPTLGVENATQIHRALLLRTLAICRTKLQSTFEVRFCITGGSDEKFRLEVDCLFEITQQSGGDLGQRLRVATATALASGFERVVIIGTDCPKLKYKDLRRAFNLLATNDFVLGPAEDGGYYLIGINLSPNSNAQEKLETAFTDIDWSTEKVFAQTKAAIENQAWTMATLRQLSDVDCPDDVLGVLPILRAHDEQLLRREPNLLSIIIPTFNEASNIAATIESIKNISQNASKPYEILIADGGSQDETVAIASKLNARIIDCAIKDVSNARGRKLNIASLVARGETLLFLHADTRLPFDYRSQIEAILDAHDSQSGITLGAFKLSVANASIALRGLIAVANWRSKRLALPYGDQAFFIKASAFEALGGFKQWPLMEDFELCRRVAKLGQIRIADSCVVTSNRRWKKLGLIRTTLRNQAIIAAYYLGVSPKRLAAYYRRKSI